jgi:hypothetical protein
MSACPLDVDVRNKLSTLGQDLEGGIRTWIEGMTGERFPPGSFAKGLKNGVLLCKFVFSSFFHFFPFSFFCTTHSSLLVHVPVSISPSPLLLSFSSNELLD